MDELSLSMATYTKSKKHEINRNEYAQHLLSLERMREQERRLEEEFMLKKVEWHYANSDLLFVKEEMELFKKHSSKVSTQTS